MTGVQITHRRHKADARAGVLPFFGEPLHGDDGRNNLHDGKVNSDSSNKQAAWIAPRGWLQLKSILPAHGKIQR
jgi:hypothetical protein